MNVITLTGNQQFMGKEIPVIYGGFGRGQKCISDKTIAEIHEQPEREIRRRINDNIKRFKESVDFIDLQKGVDESHTLTGKQRSNEITTLELLLSLGYTKSAITQAEHIYILSERGYAKLIKIMDSDTAWEVHDQLMDEYFSLREEKEQKAKELKNNDPIREQLAEAKVRNARSRQASMWLKIAQNIDIKEYKQICASYASGVLNGTENIIPLPERSERYYTATEVGQMLGGISAKRVGSIAKTNNLKTDEYGKWYHDKSQYCSKEVDTFKYNEKAVEKFKELMNINE